MKTPLYTYVRAVGLECNQDGCDFKTNVYITGYEPQAHREMVEHYRADHGLGEQIDRVAAALKAAGAIDGDHWKKPVVLHQGGAPVGAVTGD